MSTRCDVTTLNTKNVLVVLLIVSQGPCYTELNLKWIHTDEVKLYTVLPVTELNMHKYVLQSLSTVLYSSNYFASCSPWSQLL